jgi:glutamate-5-semialdehyde dehydrogenase
MTDAKEAVLAAAKLAKNAAPALAIASTETKNKALKAIAQSLIDNLDQIISVNHTDLEKAKNDGVSDYLIDRLMKIESDKFQRPYWK